jgi:hypothetical protein
MKLRHLRYSTTFRTASSAYFRTATHLVPYDDPELFNSTVERFFDAPFAKKDRIRDALKSLEKARAAHD